MCQKQSTTIAKQNFKVTCNKRWRQFYWFRLQGPQDMASAHI